MKRYTAERVIILTSDYIIGSLNRSNRDSGTGEFISVICESETGIQKVSRSNM